MLKVRDHYQLWLQRIDWKMAIRSGIAGALGFALGTYITHYLDRPDRLASGLWTTLTSIIVLQAYLGSTYKASWNRFLGVFIGSLMGALFTEYLGPGPWQLGLCVATTVIVCALITLPESYRVASVSAAVVMVLWSFNQTLSPWMFAFYRFTDTCIGITLAVIIAHTIFPEKAVDKLRKDVAETVRKLNQLYRMVFIIEPDDVPFQDLSDEIAIQLLENRETLEILKPEMAEQIDTWTLILNDVETLYESIESMAHVYNQTTREMFDSELSDHLMEVIDKSNAGFRDIALLIEKEKKETVANPLQETIDSLIAEQQRYRETHATRQYKIEAVETFFVFFYTLKTVLETLEKMESKALTLNREKGLG